MNSRTLGLWQVAAASVCFGFIGIFGKQAFQTGVTVGELLSVRFALAALLLGIGLILFRPAALRMSRAQFALCVALGVGGYNCFASLYFTSIKGVSVALAALLLYTFPFWTLLINFYLGERISRKQGLGIVGAFTGLVLLLWGRIDVESAWAILAGLGSAVAYSIYVVVSGRYQRGVSPLGSGFWIILSAAMALTILHQPDWEHIRAWTPTQWSLLFALAIIGTVIPLTLIQAGLQRLSSTETAILSMIEPVTAALASLVILQESFTSRQILGGLLVLGSLLLVAVKKTAAPPNP